MRRAPGEIHSELIPVWMSRRAASNHHPPHSLALACPSALTLTCGLARQDNDMPKGRRAHHCDRVVVGFDGWVCSPLPAGSARESLPRINNEIELNEWIELILICF